MDKNNKLYDVYVSYPPGVDKERIDACLYDNLSETEADNLIQSLAERPQAIIAENCTQEERENAQYYFSYLGLDVIVRQSMELVLENPEQQETPPAHYTHCPICQTINEDPEAAECSLCHFDLSDTNEQTIQRKRIEWQEKISFLHKKESEIAYRMQQEKEREEYRLRKQIRAELEEQQRQITGVMTEKEIFMAALQSKKHTIAAIGLGVVLVVIGLIFAGYMLAKHT